MAHLTDNQIQIEPIVGKFCQLFGDSFEEDYLSMRYEENVFDYFFSLENFKTMFTIENYSDSEIIEFVKNNSGALGHALAACFNESNLTLAQEIGKAYSI